MNNIPSPAGIELLLSSDRQAILGRLSAGLTHVMNNVLGGVIGQIDLLMITNGGPNLQKDLDQVIQICDEGVNFAKAISKVISVFNDRNAPDTNEILKNAILLISRIYRRAGLQAVLKYPSITPTTAKSDLFVQAAIHLLLMAFEDEVKNRQIGTKPVFDVALSFDAQNIFMSINNINLASVATEFPSQYEGNEYHSWVVHQVVEQGNASISYQADERICRVTWPLQEINLK